MSVVEKNLNLTLWYHSSCDTNFDVSSFKKVYKLENLTDVFDVQYSLIKREKYLLNELFYLMKDDIKPVWFNDEHVDGGCISWKITKHMATKSWENLLMLFVSNALNDLDAKYGITGISINPKKNCNILKIWFSKVIPPHELNSLKLPKECIFAEKFKIFKTFKSFMQ